MNKFFTVISLLLIVTYANCTKQVSYSEIVSSLAQVSHVEGADSLAEAVATSWAESLKKLQVYNVALNNQCTGILNRANAKEASFAAFVKGTNEAINGLVATNKDLGVQIAQAQEAQRGNQANAEKLREEMKNDAGVLQDKSLAIVERARVLRRLSNLVQDELTGAQRQSTVGNFKVDNKLSGFSFVEVHNQLKELDSHDPIVKSMITTLILVTADRNFANQAQVGKIQHMIDEIIRKDAAHGAAIRKQVADKAAAINKTLTELADDMFKQMNAIAEHKAAILNNTNIIAFARGELSGMQAHIKRAAERKASNMAVCKHVQDLNKVYRHDFSAGIQRFADLRKLVQ